MNRNSGSKHPLIGEVYNMYFDGSDHEQAGWRPGVVFQNNVGNAFSPNIIALPITSKIKKEHMPTHVVVKSADSGLRVDSMVICENPKCISKSKLGTYITRLSDEYMRSIAIGSMMATGAMAFMDFKSLFAVWQESYRLNGVA